MMKQGVTIVIIGRVQGVGFRYHTLRKAQELGISGTVMNLQDGSVCIEAEAEEGALSTFLAWCHEGPRWARVEKVEVQPAGLRNFFGFSIL